jgi:hypothetical protein
MVVLVALAMAASACSPSALPTASADPTPASNEPADPAVMAGVDDCPDPQPPPGAFTDDIVPAVDADIADDPDASAGTGTLCIGLAAPRRLDVDVTCHWSIDRDRVVEVTSTPVTTDAAEVFATWGRTTVDGAAESTLFRVEPDGEARYSATEPAIVVTVGPGAATGRLDAAGILPADGGGAGHRFSGTNGVPAVGYTLAWRCAPPPPAVAGLGRGSVVVAFDAPDVVVELPARCTWDRGADTQPRVWHVSMDPTSIADGLEVAGTLALPPHGMADESPPEVRIEVGGPAFGGPRRSYEPDIGEASISWLDITAGAATGFVRFRDLGAREADDPAAPRVLGFPDDAASGTVRWSCAPPIRPPDPRIADDPDGPRLVPGTITVDLDRPLEGRHLDGTASCALEPMVDDEVHAGRVLALLREGSGWMRVDLRRDLLRIARLDEAGRFIGEYEGRTNQSGDIRDRPFHLFVPTQPVGDAPHLQPYRVGDAVVDRVGWFIEYACDVTAAAG